MVDKTLDMTFSVVITSFNRPDYLLKAVESVAHQDLPANEIIIVDDHSDFSVEILLKEFTYLPIRILTKQKRQGASHSRNLGIEQSTSDYIAFLDDDDAFLPERLSFAAREFSQFPQRVASLCSYSFMDGSERRNCPPSEDVDQEKLKRGNVYCGTSGLVIKASAARANKFDEEVPSGEDWELFVRLSQKGNFYFNDQPLFLYRVGEHSSKTNQKKHLRIAEMQERFTAAKKHKDWLGNRHYLTRVATQILGDLGSKKEIWKWVNFSLREVGFPITMKVILSLTGRKLARLLRYQGLSSR